MWNKCKLINPLLGGHGVQLYITISMIILSIIISNLRELIGPLLGGQGVELVAAHRDLLVQRLHAWSAKRLNINAAPKNN